MFKLKSSVLLQDFVFKHYLALVAIDLSSAFFCDVQIERLGDRTLIVEEFAHFSEIMENRVEFNEFDEEFVKLHLIFFAHRLVIVDHLNSLSVHVIVVNHTVLKHHVCYVLTDVDELQFSENHVELFLQIDQKVN